MLSACHSFHPKTYTIRGQLMEHLWVGIKADFPSKRWLKPKTKLTEKNSPTPILILTPNWCSKHSQFDSQAVFKPTSKKIKKTFLLNCTVILMSVLLVVVVIAYLTKQVDSNEICSCAKEVAGLTHKTVLYVTYIICNRL